MRYYYIGPNRPNSQQGTAASDLAAEIAQQELVPCSFEDTDQFGNLEEHGVAFPCGCISQDTILSDGSIGWGSWMDRQCGVTHCLEDENE